MVSVAGGLEESCRRWEAELGPGPGVRESRGGEELEDLEVGVLAEASFCNGKEMLPCPALQPSSQGPPECYLHIHETSHTSRGKLRHRAVP